MSDRTRRAIAAVEHAGAVFVMVTGRPPSWMPAVAEQTGYAGLAVCANGALLYDLHTDRVLRSFLLPAAEARDVIDALRASIPGIAFAVERGEAGFGREHSYVARWDNGDVQVAEVEELIADGAVKLLARVEGAASDDLLGRARSAVGHLVETTHSSYDGLLEISALGISKASGLAAVADQHAISAGEVIAFGDMPNDLPMFAWAGHAVAVANAHPAVLAAADEVTASNEEDGVAAVLERWF